MVRGHAFIDYELYLPKSWIDDRARITKEHVLKEMMDRENSGFVTKPALALAMIDRPLGECALLLRRRLYHLWRWRHRDGVTAR